MFGKLPKVISDIECSGSEYLYYLYMPIKFPNMYVPRYEDRIKPYENLIKASIFHFWDEIGLARYEKSYVYLTIKRRYQTKDNFINREGWHSDNFGDDSINYIWSDMQPSVFNSSNFNLSNDDSMSMVEMKKQALLENNVTYPNNSLLQLDQYCIHKVGEIEVGVRTFFKLTISDFKFNYYGNTHNYHLYYNWEMKQRKASRNLTH